MSLNHKMLVLLCIYNFTLLHSACPLVASKVQQAPDLECVS